MVQSFYSFREDDVEKKGRGGGDTVLRIRIEEMGGQMEKRECNERQRNECEEENK